MGEHPSASLWFAGLAAQYLQTDDWVQGYGFARWAECGDVFFHWPLHSLAMVERKTFVTRREIAFLLVGLGVGLALSIVAIVEILSSLYHHMFIVGYSWDKPIALIPFLLMFAGLILLLSGNCCQERRRE
jgi:hypothetical protein